MRQGRNTAPELMMFIAALLLAVAGCPNTETTPETIVAGLTQGNDATCQIPGNEDALHERLLSLINKERTDRGLNALTINPILTQVAEDYCCEMIEGNFFAHENPNTGERPGNRAINAGYVFLAIGENLAGGQSSPEQVMVEWMDSSSHRENILATQWREVGIGVRTGGIYGVYWVLEFGNPP